MKTLLIPLTDEVNTNSNVEEVASLLATFPKNNIDYQPWGNHEINCQTSFSIAHNGKAIFLKYEVAEDVIKVNTYETNGPVNKDNCVEFFVSFGSEKGYYNLEVNCVGIIRMAYGEKRANRISLTEEAINRIKTHIEIRTSPANSLTKYLWQISLTIPIEAFEYSSLKTLHQQTCFGNFFKCGDDLPQKHFYAWNKIDAEAPDFHLPAFFGSLHFN
ncbi:carbohydrate-binding family 9-like protein [Pedobacter arcticus]|uniref:carbohydrate-binding family 9-like protein n=1 Tax=Pedobacter arcticus TaxID=752140 RepID=UPI00031665D4|nr:carbohydrate-binding family 9-like protein [Pedobacter arcticus]